MLKMEKGIMQKVFIFITLYNPVQINWLK